jgi:hypothetical protein
VRIRHVDDETPRHRGDARSLDPITRAATAAPIARIRDVLLVVFVGNDAGERADPGGDPPVPVARGVVLKQFPTEEAELVRDASMARGHYFVPSYQETPLWGFEREIDAATHKEQPFAWDTDGTLITTMKLSRYIVDNGYTPEFAARIVDHADGEQQVIPQWLHYLDLLPSYRMRMTRDWLTTDDAAALGQLVERYWERMESLPRQVARALNLSEGVVHTNVYDRTLVLMMMGLEALLNTGPVSVSRQMKHRMRLLAAELGIAGVSGNWAEKMYSARSKPAHGQELRLASAAPDAQAEGADEIPGEALADGSRLQDLLRAAVRRAIEDDAFGDIFSSPENIRARWPVEGSRWRISYLRHVRWLARRPWSRHLREPVQL